MSFVKRKPCRGVTLYGGDAERVLRSLDEDSVQCVVTSPPYWALRDYGTDGELGSECAPGEYIERLAQVMDEVLRILRWDGTLWLNLGDTYVAKDLQGIPWRVAFALQRSGWTLRQEIIWHKPCPKPENAKDRFTRAHEQLFLFVKQPKYHCDMTAIRQKAVGSVGGSSFGKQGQDDTGTGASSRKYARPVYTTRNCHDVWTLSPANYKGAHFAVFPEKLVEPCVLAGCPKGGVVLDPFIGSGTTAVVARRLGRKCIGIDLNREYLKLVSARIRKAEK